jgi:rhodanese-related sulfurtransferase
MAREEGAGQPAERAPSQADLRRLKELPKSKDYVAYCRGPYCVYADRAVEILRASGRRARRLVEGFPEWRSAGLPVTDGGPVGALM